MIKNTISLPDKYIFRKAKLVDVGVIAFLIFKARLDPTQLKWEQFLVIESYGRLIAFGQLRNFDSAQELGSLYVVPNFRNQGLGTFLVKNLVIQANKPLYLKCVKKELVKFYTNTGFIPVSFDELPQSLKIKFYLSYVRNKYFNASITFMKYKSLIELPLSKV
jgi:amino-acid N-acetyltransferase